MIKNVCHLITVSYTIIKHFETFDDPQNTKKAKDQAFFLDLFDIGNNFIGFSSSFVNRDFLPEHYLYLNIGRFRTLMSQKLFALARTMATSL